MQTKKCCFTGHRNVIVNTALKGRLWDALHRLVEEYGVTDFYAGGAVGFDMLCERAVIALKKEYPQVKLHLILPCNPESQTGRWGDEQKQLYYNIQANSDSCTVLSEKYYPGCMKRRNEELVKNADFCICYYNPDDASSGTGQTVRMCEKNGITVINIYESPES